MCKRFTRAAARPFSRSLARSLANIHRTRDGWCRPLFVFVSLNGVWRRLALLVLLNYSFFSRYYYSFFISFAFFFGLVEFSSPKTLLSITAIVIDSFSSRWTFRWCARVCASDVWVCAMRVSKCFNIVSMTAAAHVTSLSFLHGLAIAWTQRKKIYDKLQYTHSHECHFISTFFSLSSSSLLCVVVWIARSRLLFCTRCFPSWRRLLNCI